MTSIDVLREHRGDISATDGDELGLHPERLGQALGQLDVEADELALSR